MKETTWTSPSRNETLDLFAVRLQCSHYATLLLLIYYCHTQRSANVCGVKQSRSWHGSEYIQKCLEKYTFQREAARMYEMYHRTIYLYV